MKRLRAQLSLSTAVTAALFALYIGVPRAALFYHSHAGSERAHVHADDGGAAELLAELYGHHHHHHQHDASGRDVADAPTQAQAAAPQHRDTATAVRTGTALRYDDGASNGHWHRQDRFQRGVTMAPASVVGSAPSSPLHLAPPARAPHAAARDLRARGPPVSAPA